MQEFDQKFLTGFSFLEQAWRAGPLAGLAKDFCAFERHFVRKPGDCITLIFRCTNGQVFAMTIVQTRGIGGIWAVVNFGSAI